MRAVFWSARARRDYHEILHYIAQDNPNAAEKVAEAIEKAGDDLGEFATGKPGRVTGTYEKQVVHLPYIIAYEVTASAGAETVSILRVVHGARDWQAESWPD